MTSSCWFIYFFLHRWWTCGNCIMTTLWQSWPMLRVRSSIINLWCQILASHAIIEHWTCIFMHTLYGLLVLWSRKCCHTNYLMRDVMKIIPIFCILMTRPNVCLYAQKITPFSRFVKISFQIFFKASRQKKFVWGKALKSDLFLFHYSFWLSITNTQRHDSSFAIYQD